VHVNGLLIDVDNVLYDSTFWDRWLFKLLNRFGVVGSYLCHERVWALDYLPAVNRGLVDYWVALRRYLISVGLTSAQIEEVVAASKIRHANSLESRRLFPAARIALLRLSSALPITLVANTFETGSQVSSNLRRSGISSNVASVLTSRDVGEFMHHEKFLKAALKKMSLRSQVHVGLVSKNSEILAQASQLGLSTIGVAIGAEMKCDWKFDRFEQLAENLGHQHTNQRMAS